MNKKFKKTLKEKYGLKGEKGRDGELFFSNFYTRKGYIVHDNHDDIKQQTSGVDFVLETQNGVFSVDVKNNLIVSPKETVVVVEVQPSGWLFDPKKISVYISHVNTKNRIIATYRRTKMQQFIDTNYWDYRSSIIYLPITMLPFCKVEYDDKEQ